MKKSCSCCGLEYEKTFFYRNKSTKDGLQSQCKICHNKTSNNWGKRNPDLLKASIDKYAKNNRSRRVDSVKRFQKNPDNKGKVLSWKKISDARRRAAKINALPVWASLDEVREIYNRATALTLQTGICYHVDHIVPLLGKQVCGLHVQNNLRIITAFENISKGNKF